MDRDKGGEGSEGGALREERLLRNSNVQERAEREGKNEEARSRTKMSEKGRRTRKERKSTARQQEEQDRERYQAFVSPKTPVMLVGHASHAHDWLTGACASYGLCWPCTRRHASHARGGMPVTDYAGHARLHANYACRGMPVTLEHARHA